MGKKKKDTMELRFYEVPQNEYVLALLGDSWIRDYGHDESNLHFHNLMEIGYCKHGTGELILNEESKPFEPMELIARVNSNLRRYEQILNLKGSTQKPSNQLIVGGLVLDQATKEVFVNGQSVRLTKKEFQILELLMSYPGKVYSAEEIYESIWEETAINTETIMVHVRRLREKIEANPKHPEYLKAVWGVGYKIEKME